MRAYELIVLLHPDLEIDAETPITKLEKLITQYGGKVTKRDNWGKRRLAYRVKKQDFAVYVYFEIQIEPTQVRELENAILITEEVLRHLLVSRVEMDKPKKVESKTAPEAETKAEEKISG